MKRVIWLLTASVGVATYMPDNLHLDALELVCALQMTHSGRQGSSRHRSPRGALPKRSSRLTASPPFRMTSVS